MSSRAGIVLITHPPATAAVAFLHIDRVWSHRYTNVAAAPPSPSVPAAPSLSVGVVRGSMPPVGCCVGCCVNPG